MRVGDRMDRARRLALLQKVRTTEVLSQQEELPPIGSQMERPRAVPTRMAMRVTEVVELCREARAMPWGARKAWIYLIAGIGALVSIPALVVSPLGGMIILPLVLGALAIVANTPFWLAKSVQTGNRNNRSAV